MGSSQAPAPGAPCHLCPPPHGSPDPLLSRLPPGAASADRSPRPVPSRSPRRQPPSLRALLPAGDQPRSGLSSASCGPSTLHSKPTVPHGTPSQAGSLPSPRPPALTPPFLTAPFPKGQEGRLSNGLAQGDFRARGRRPPCRWVVAGCGSGPAWLSRARRPRGPGGPRPAHTAGPCAGRGQSTQGQAVSTSGTLFWRGGQPVTGQTSPGRPRAAGRGSGAAAAPPAPGPGGPRLWGGLRTAFPWETDLGT